MKLQQLIVEAKNSTDRSENVIVGKSSCIKQELLGEAINWSTIRSGIFHGQNAATFYCRSRAGTGMFGRSFAGGADSEGNRTLRTHFVLVSSNQLKCYDNNPVLIVKLLNSSGGWILKTDDVETELPELELSDLVINTFTFPQQAEKVKQMIDAMEIHDRVAITNTSNPLDFIGNVLQSYSFGQRSKISFALERHVRADAPFRINAYACGDKRLEANLSKHRVCSVGLRAKAVQAS